MSGNGAASATKKKPISRSRRAGLLFPVGRLARYLKNGRYSKRIGAGAPVYLAAVLEYLAAEMLEMAAKACHDSGRTRITPRHILLGKWSDEELRQLLSSVTIAQGGVEPFIPSFPLPKKTAAGKRKLKKEAASKAEKTTSNSQDASSV